MIIACGKSLEEISTAREQKGRFREATDKTILDYFKYGPGAKYQRSQYERGDTNQPRQSNRTVWNLVTTRPLIDKLSSPAE